MNRDDAINTLLDLIAVCRDNRRRYEIAAASSSDNLLVTLLEHCAARREQYALHLADITRSMGGSLNADHDTLPTYLTDQFDLESFLKPENEAAAIAACERGEAQALRCYLVALAVDLPKQVQHILEHQYEQTRMTYIYLSNLREAASSYIHIVRTLTGKSRNGKFEEMLMPSPINIPRQ